MKNGTKTVWLQTKYTDWILFHEHGIENQKINTLKAPQFSAYDG